MSDRRLMATMALTLSFTMACTMVRNWFEGHHWIAVASAVIGVCWSGLALYYWKRDIPS